MKITYIIQLTNVLKTHSVAQKRREKKREKKKKTNKETSTDVLTIVQINFFYIFSRIPCSPLKSFSNLKNNSSKKSIHFHFYTDILFEVAHDRAR